MRKNIKVFLIIFIISLVVGSYFRISNIQNLSFSGDEETTTMAAIGAMQDGVPHFPSGMKYYRSLPHIYLLSIIFSKFGVGELQARIPSVILGIGLIFLLMYLAYLIYPDKSFALLVGIFSSLSCYFIEEARTARMYGPFIFFYSIYLIFIIRHFRTQKTIDLIFAVIFMLFSITLHRIAIFGIFFVILLFFLFNDKKIKLFSIGFSIVIGGFWIFMNFFIRSGWKNFVFSNGFPVKEVNEVSSFQFLYPKLEIILLNLFFLFLFLIFLNRKKLLKLSFFSNYFSFVLIGLFLLGYIHLGWIALAGYFLWKKDQNKISIFIFLFGLIISSVDFFYYFLSVPSLKQSLKFLLTFPNFTEIYFIRNFPVFSIALLILAFSSFIFKNKNFHKYIILGVFLPIVVLSFFRQEFPIRYLVFLTPLMIIIITLIFYQAFKIPIANFIRYPAIIVLVGLILWEIAPPKYLFSYINPQYGDPMFTWEYGRPDHKGAALFVKENMQPEDVVISVDALETKLYLGKVDYWLRRKSDLNRYLYKDKKGVKRDVYTNSIHLEKLEEIEKIKNNNKNIWLIDSGETFLYGSKNSNNWLRHYYLNNEIIQFIDDSKSNLVYVGRDGLTNVYKYTKDK